MWDTRTKILAFVISNVHHLFIKKAFSQLHNYNFKMVIICQGLTERPKGLQNPYVVPKARSAFLPDSIWNGKRGQFSWGVRKPLHTLFLWLKSPPLHGHTWASCGTWKASILSVKYVVSCLSSSPKLSCKTWSMWSVSRRTWSCFSKEICLLSAYTGEKWNH